MSNESDVAFRTYEEINEKISRGDAVVMTAEEFTEYAQVHGVRAAAKEVDVVTTGTFGAMCSSGAFLNFGHSEPPIKMSRCWLNDVPAYKGIAAVDAYIGATAMSETEGFEYGGGHVIEDLVNGKDIELRAEGYGTDCYPRLSLTTTIRLEDLNQAILLDPRNAYQHYNAATNSTDRLLYTYMGTLLPRLGNVTYCGAGELSPLSKDSGYETIGIGTRIFLAGGVGYVVGEGTQHAPQKQFGTLMLRGDLKQMKARYLRGATFHRYGTTLYVGVGVPIPILDYKVAKTAAASDAEISTDILDYGVPSRERPVVSHVTYESLKSGEVSIGRKNVRTSPLSSFKYAKEIAETLKSWILAGSFLLTKPVEPLPSKRDFRGLRVRVPEPTVKDAMTTKVATAKSSDDITTIAKTLVTRNINHLPIVDEENRLVGMVTSWDIAKAMALGEKSLSRLMRSRVVTAREDDSIDMVSGKLSQHNISGVPVIDDQNHVVGIVTASDVARLLGGKAPK
jgi:uncharacterized protein (DUF39 family)/predicted transcriptional regulator